MALPIILGSSSIHRKRILDSLGIKFTTLSPDIDEKAIRDPDPSILTRKIARAKADALLAKIDYPAILITSDQVILHNGVIREKPEDEEECREYLRSYRKNPATCYSSVCVCAAPRTNDTVFLEGTGVAVQHFKYLPDDFIEKLIKQGDVLSCAGGFAIELMEGYLDKTEGEMETVIGMPKSITLDFVHQLQNNK